METIVFIHERLATTMLIFMLACAVWGLALFFKGAGMTPSYWGTLAIGELLILVQCLLGLIAWLSGRVPLRADTHMLYGLAAALALPAAFFYTRGRESRYETLIYGLVCAFLAGVAMRGMLTGGA